jgi:hypothetical protein
VEQLSTRPFNALNQFTFVEDAGSVAAACVGAAKRADLPF